MHEQACRPYQCQTVSHRCAGAAAQDVRRCRRDLRTFQDTMRGLLAKNLKLDLKRSYGAAVQDVRRGKRDLRAFQDMMRGLLAELRARGPPADGDTTIAAHLLRMRDPASGQPLSDDQLLPEVRASERCTVHGERCNFGCWFAFVVLQLDADSNDAEQLLPVSNPVQRLA